MRIRVASQRKIVAPRFALASGSRLGGDVVVTFSCNRQ